MDLSSFFKLLLRHKYTLIVVPLAAVIITYFLVRNQPDSYLSGTQIATGIVDQTQKGLNSSENLQDAQVNQQFSNLTTMLRSKKMLDQLSYLLMIHDLSENAPYRKPSKTMQGLNSQVKANALASFKDLYSKRQSLSLFNKDQKALHDLITSMNYDDVALSNKLTVYRDGNSDFIVVQFESENPYLSATVVNDLCKEFISYYTYLVKENQRKAVDFYSDLLRDKQDTLSKRLDQLKEYKIQNRVLSLSEQAKSLYGQVSDFETRREQAEKDAIAYKAAIDNIDSQFDPTDRRYIESSMVRINQQLLNTRSQLEAVNDQYVQSGFDNSYQKKIDSLTRVIAGQISRAGDKYIVNPMVNKQSLIQQKLTLQIQYDLANSSKFSIQKELVRLNERLTKLVPHEAVVQADESAIQIARDEYMDVLEKYNQTRLESSFSVLLRQLETAMPGAAQPSKKMLLVIISGVVSFMFCVVVLFALFYMDNTIKTPRDLANATKTPVLGYLNRLEGSSLNLRELWMDNRNIEGNRSFTNLMQAIRYEIDTELHGKKILVINSLAKDEGKTFFALNLAYAYSLVNKKVLLIDGDFTYPDITKAVKAHHFFEDYFEGGMHHGDLSNSSNITVLGNKGKDVSLFQVGSEEDVRHELDQLKHIYDIVIIEAPALNAMNRSKEWVTVADRVVTVLKAGQALKDNKKAHISYLKGLNGKFVGWVLNEVDKSQLPTAEQQG